MTALQRRRVRGHVPPGPPPTPRPSWEPRPDEHALLLHVLADDRDQLTVASTRELVRTGSGLVTISERLFTPGDLVVDVRGRLAGALPDVPPGLAIDPLRVDDTETLGPLVCRRSYSQRWPVVMWDLAWTLGRLAAHTGRAFGRRDGFSVSLAGTGTSVDGRWAPSWHYPTLMMNPRSGGSPGAFFHWKQPANITARTSRTAHADFLSLQLLTSAVAGADFDDPAQACAWFDIAWPTHFPELLARVRAETRALAALYDATLRALIEVAPGLHPRDVWSFGSLAHHALTTAGVRPPLAKITDGPDQ